MINRAITHCENNGLGCHENIPELLEECQKENMSDIASCHDGRMEQFSSICILIYIFILLFLGLYIC